MEFFFEKLLNKNAFTYLKTIFDVPDNYDIKIEDMCAISMDKMYWNEIHDEKNIVASKGLAQKWHKGVHLDTQFSNLMHRYKEHKLQMRKFGKNSYDIELS